MPTQTESGRAFEYGLAQAFRKTNKARIYPPDNLAGIKAAYEKQSDTERQRIDLASGEAAIFIACHDDNAHTANSVYLPSNAEGQRGDVRDLVLKGGGSDVGISAKNRHKAVKHSRLSDKIDFGKRWADHPNSSHYWKEVKPIFKMLRDIRDSSYSTALFRDIENKSATVYAPVLMAFEDELVRLCEDYRSVFVKRLFQYLLGKHDHYKVVKENGTVAIQSININGSLGWGKKWRIPDRVADIQRPSGRRNMLHVAFSGGWLLSFRLHNASSRVEPSLKFDIQFVGMPQDVARHEITLLGEVV